MNKIYIIAEAGVNHNGSRDTAFKLIDAACEAGADAVKFQTFKASELVIPSAAKAAYQLREDGQGDQLSMLQKLELTYDIQRDLFEYCQTRGIAFLSSPFDMESAEFLIYDLGLDTIKLGSGELSNAQMLYRIAQQDVKIILSTGMSTLDEIERALGIAAAGYTSDLNNPRRQDFANSWEMMKETDLLTDKITLLHCTTEYPCPVNEVNLYAMRTLAEKFRLPVGYSDHTRGIHISLAAATMGACIIEKHFTLDRSQPGPDHRASLEPDELKNMVHAIRDIEQALGSGEKSITPAESKNRPIARKGLYARTAIKKGEIFTKTNVAVKRPETTISAFDYWDVLGNEAKKDYKPDDPL